MKRRLSHAHFAAILALAGFGSVATLADWQTSRAVPADVALQLEAHARRILDKVLEKGGAHAGRSAYVTKGNRVQRARQLAGMMHKNSGRGGSGV